MLAKILTFELTFELAKFARDKISKVVRLPFREVIFKSYINRLLILVDDYTIQLVGKKIINTWSNLADQLNMNKRDRHVVADLRCVFVLNY